MKYSYELWTIESVQKLTVATVCDSDTDIGIFDEKGEIE